jgi:molybdopterin-containing oxidoreductase family membrane subunit
VANLIFERPRPETPVVAPGHTYRSVTEKISAIVQGGPARGWLAGFGLASALVLVFFAAVAWLLLRGVGIWGLNVPIAWAVDITSFVWWIGIGHAGTLISAVLLLFRQRWRTSINRFAEAMTLLAVACASLFPLLHLGRPWFFYWMIPYPNTMGVWPQFRSPLVWDFFAIMAYGTVSLLFWYTGLIPDLATLRDRARRRIARVIYGFLAMGWRGSARHWRRYETTYFLLAALATPLVVSVHTIVSFDFAVGLVPGWHSTIFPPYFVAGALFSGLAMVLTIAIPLRAVFRLEDFITGQHLDNLARLVLVSSLVVAYGYLMEGFTAWYSGHPAEIYVQVSRVAGPYAFLYWLLLACNVLAPQALWFVRARSNPLVLFAISLAVNVGMWLERFIIIVSGLSRDFLPSSWDTYRFTVWDWATFLGTLGVFAALLFLFVRFLPVISIFEMRELISEEEGEQAAEAGADGRAGPEPRPAWKPKREPA